MKNGCTASYNDVFFSVKDFQETQKTFYLEFLLLGTWEIILKCIAQNAGLLKEVGFSRVKLKLNTVGLDFPVNTKIT